MKKPKTLIEAAIEQDPERFRLLIEELLAPGFYGVPISAILADVTWIESAVGTMREPAAHDSGNGETTNA